MTPLASALSAAHESWKGCIPSQCTRECPHLAPAKRPSRALCMRYAEHLAAAALASIDDDVKRTWVEAYGNSDGDAANG